MSNVEKVSHTSVCNGGAWKVGGSDCYYDFEVDLNSDCVGTTTVRLALTEIGGSTYWYLCQPTMDPPYPDCVPMGVRVQLDGDKHYGYHFVATGGCSDQEPPVGNVLLDPDCD